MKTPREAIVVIASMLGVSAFAEPQQHTDLGKAFPTEKLEIAHREGAVEWSLFTTSLEFPELRAKLLRFLGDGWELAEYDKEAEASLRAEVEEAWQPLSVLAETIHFTDSEFGDVKR